MKNFKAKAIALAALCLSVFGTATMANAAELTQLKDKEHWQQIYNSSDKPVFVFLTSADCQPCAVIESVLKTESDKYQNMTFLKADAKAFGVAPEELPFAVILEKSVGQVWVKANLGTEKLAETLKERLDFVAKLVDLQKQVKEAAAAINTVETPFNERIDGVKKKAKEALGPIEIREAELREKIAAARKPFDDQIAEIAAKRTEALRVFAADQAALSKDRDATTAPFRAEIRAIQAEREKASAELEKKHEALEEQLYKLRAADSAAQNK